MTSLKVPVTSNDHIQGDEKAPIVLVEYGDYECPHCCRAYPIVKQIQEQFGADLAFVYRNFPLKEIHPNAEAAAETAEFAAEFDRFWEMHDDLFENQEALAEPLLLGLAEANELSPKKLEEALAQEKYAPRVKSDFLSGVRSGVNGTPTFFINGQRHDGPFDFEALRDAIAALLA